MTTTSATAFQFGTETFRPICIRGNSKAELPVEFDLSSVGGASRARLKSIIIATSGLAQVGEWSPEVQDAVIKAFETGAAVFADGVTAIRRMTAPAALCVRVGLLRELPKDMDPQTQIPIANGYEFSLVCGYWPILAYEVALALARVSGQAEIDPRFFDWLSTSVGMPAIRRGTAERVESKPGVVGIAAKRRRKGRRSTRATSRRSA